jgi:hypothetical protein
MSSEPLEPATEPIRLGPGLRRDERIWGPASPQIRTTIITRRFWARPLGEALDATGSSSP